MCRLLVYPILRLVGKSSIQEIGSEEAQVSVENTESERPVEIVKLSENPPNSAPQPLGVAQQEIPQTPLQLGQQMAIPNVQPSAPMQAVQQNQANSGTGGSSGEEKRESESTRVEIPQHVLERIQQLEEELSKIKNYVRASVDGIKATLVDLRSAIAELSNPFNILRKYADIFFGEEVDRAEDGKRGNKQSSTQQQVASLYPAPIQIITYPYPHATQVPSIEEKSSARDLNGEASQKKKEGVLELSKPEALRAVVLWVNRALDKLDIEGLAKLVDSYVKAKLVSPEVGEALKVLISIIYDLKSRGVSIEEQVAIVSELFTSALHRDMDNSGAREGESKAGEELLELIEGG